MKSATAKSATFVTRVKAALDGLPPSERHLAEFLLDFPGDLASYTATELAAKCSVSNATISRLFRRLGYASYVDARRHVRQEKSAGSPLLLTAAGAQPAEGSIAAHLQAGVANLTETLGTLAEAEIAQVAAAMLAARAVWFAGFRNNHSFAAYLRRQTMQVLPDTRLLPGAGDTLGEDLASIERDDVVIVFAVRRTPAVARDVLVQAAQAGAKALCVTDQSTRDPGPATWTIRCRTTAPGALYNHVAVIGLAHLLATRVLEQAGARGRKRLSRIEAVHDALSEL